jgi:ferric-dicitrate binding protein FerR (iron transport regulator)
MDREILHRFFMNTASFEEEEAVCDWVDISDENKQMLIKERKYFDLVLLQKENKQDAKKTSPYLKSFVVLKETLKIAAAIAVITVSVMYIYNAINASEQVALNKIVVPPGQRVNVTLADGTNVWLNACTEMTYPVSFLKKERKVSLKGEAYFDVVKDEKHPFVVQTGFCDIKVLGTKFNICEEGVGRAFTASLFDGSIELINKANSGKNHTLSPMQKAEWRNGKFQIDSIRDMDIYRWKEGLICFENIRFEELMQRFERVFDIRIVIQSGKLKDYRFSGKCRVADGVDYILKVLQRNKPFLFKRIGDDNDHPIIYIE